MKWSVFPMFFVLAAIAVSAQEPITQSLKTGKEITVIITVPDNLEKFQKSTKIRKKRFQFREDTTGITLNMSQSPRLFVRKSRLNPEGRFVMNREALRANTKREQDSVWKSMSLFYDKSELPNKNHYAAAVNRFVTGKNGGSLMASQWHTVGVAATSGEVKGTVKTGWFKKFAFATDTLPGAERYLLPAFNEGKCKPIDRFYERKKLHGYGIDKFKYQRYVPYSRKIIRKNFEVYFARNKTDVAPGDLAGIRQFLENNNLVILKATIEGFSSIEGTAERNRELQEQRAGRLLKELQLHNNEPIKSDTVIFSEAWEPFKQSLKTAGYEGLDSLDIEQLRSTVNADTALSKSLEPLFRQDRKATLKLTLADKHSTSELVDKLLEDFNLQLDLLKAGDVPANRPIEAKLLGMMAWLDKMYEAGLTDSVNVAWLVDTCHRPTEASILHFYHVVKTHEGNRHHAGFEWDSLFARNKWNNVFTVATRNAILQISGQCLRCRFQTEFVEISKRTRQLVDIQFYTFKYIQEGILDPDVLCSITYPPIARYYGFKLNHMAMAYELSKTHFFSCYGFTNNENTVSVKKELSFRKLAGDSTAGLQSASTVAGKPRVSFDEGEKGDYYFFVKTLAMSGESKIREFVMTSDSWFEFDLFNIVRWNVDEWDPVGNHFYDKEIRLNEMHKLISRLKAIDKHICPVDINQLYLDFHMKSLFYLDRFAIPGNQPQMNMADRSLRYISEYYASRNAMLYPRITLPILKQLHMFYWLPTKKSSIQHAFDILAQVERRRMLSEEEQALWATYLKLYAPKRSFYHQRKLQSPGTVPPVTKTLIVAGK